MWKIKKAPYPPTNSVLSSNVLPEAKPGGMDLEW